MASYDFQRGREEKETAVDSDSHGLAPCSTFKAYDLEVNDSTCQRLGTFAIFAA